MMIDIILSNLVLIGLAIWVVSISLSVVNTSIGNFGKSGDRINNITFLTGIIGAMIMLVSAIILGLGGV